MNAAVCGPGLRPQVMSHDGVHSAWGAVEPRRARERETMVSRTSPVPRSTTGNLGPA